MWTDYLWFCISLFCGKNGRNWSKADGFFVLFWECYYLRPLKISRIFSFLRRGILSIIKDEWCACLPVFVYFIGFSLLFSATFPWRKTWSLQWFSGMRVLPFSPSKFHFWTLWIICQEPYNLCYSQWILMICVRLFYFPVQQLACEVTGQGRQVSVRTRLLVLLNSHPFFFNCFRIYV